MAGTDRTRAAGTGDGPAVVLVRTQLSENLGVAARAMLNCGLTDLRLVATRADPAAERALAAASGADSVLAGARRFQRLEAAIGDCGRVYATTARPRELIKRVVTPRQAALEMRAAAARGERVALVFGPERTGLVNDEVALADTLVQVPLNPGFSSLNLAQAVLLLGYEWFQAGDETPPESLPLGDTRPANRAELLNFFTRLESGLEEGGFFTSEAMRPHMTRNLRTLFERAGLTEQEIRTLHGVVFALRKAPPQPGRPRRRARDPGAAPEGEGGQGEGGSR